MATQQDFLAPLTPRAAELLDEIRRPSSLRENLLGRKERDLAGLNELTAAAEPRMIPPRVAVAAIASFHPDGYVREAAVAWLDTLDVRALPFLLLRLNDWVPQVAERALRAVLARLTETNADALIDCLPLVASLERSTRRDHGAVIEGVDAVLRDSAQREALARGRQSPGPLPAR